MTLTASEKAQNDIYQELLNHDKYPAEKLYEIFSNDGGNHLNRKKIREYILEFIKDKSYADEFYFDMNMGCINIMDFEDMLRSVKKSLEKMTETE
jgi:hypothetical protein